MVIGNVTSGSRAQGSHGKVCGMLSTFVSEYIIGTVPWITLISVKILELDTDEVLCGETLVFIYTSKSNHLSSVFFFIYVIVPQSEF